MTETPQAPAYGPIPTPAVPEYRIEEIDGEAPRCALFRDGRACMVGARDALERFVAEMRAYREMFGREPLSSDLLEDMVVVVVDGRSEAIHRSSVR